MWLCVRQMRGENVMKPTAAQLMGRAVTLTDERTGFTYDAIIADARSVFGRTEIRVRTHTPLNQREPNVGRWFAPTASELEGVN
jgi:hypothetical protein